MSDEGVNQLDAFITAGTLLQAAREARGLSQREVADSLHLVPGYPAILESDDYKALRHPAFARGYVKAYGKLLGVDEQRLLAAFDRLRAQEAAPAPKVARARPVQLQRTGLGMVIGLVLLVVLVAAVWWWQEVPQADAAAVGVPAGDSAPEQIAHDDFTTGER
ncbi:MAG: helix-turn-helix domain-containing protein [Pseudomonadales bacterium]|nr:helix-turn-helix domain-containing protein [Pseudomonadales bacterium]